MRRTIGLSLLFILLLGMASFGAPSAFANDGSSDLPYMLTSEYKGTTLCKTAVYLSNNKGLTFAQTKSSGFKKKLKKGTAVTVIGRDSEGGKWFYIRQKISKKNYYGYVSSKNVCINNGKTSVIRSVTKYNSFYKRKIKYNYTVKNGMPFYEFDQGNAWAKGKKINGLFIGYSCGPHTIAAALSALNGDIIFPEVILKNMSRDAIAPDYKGTSTSAVISSVKPYIKKKYKLNYEYEIINRSDIFNYLRNGYMVITAVENHDNLAIFTKNAHFILLVGYDETGNVIAINSNKRFAFFNSFSEARIGANFPDTEYDGDTLAIKWRYDDSYAALPSPVATNLTGNAKAYQHYYNYGKITKLSAGAAVTLLGSCEKSYYISYTLSGKTHYGFIDKKYISIS